MTFISRRDVLIRIGMTSAAVRSAKAFALHNSALHQPLEREGFSRADSFSQAASQHFTQPEAALMDAIVGRLIPSDQNGPGAKEAGAVRYIDMALGGALSSSRQAYASGLAALDRYARASRGAPFTELSPVDQDSVLIDVETGTATGFTGSSAAFFAMLLNHTHQGTFGDPFYGGNANFVGWDLIRYPGIRLNVTPADQKALEEKRLPPNRRSAYDGDTFHKAERPE